MKPNLAERRQQAAVFVALLLFNLVLVLLQLWLLVSVLEGTIRGKTAMAIPAAVASVGLLVVNLWMLRGLSRRA